MSENIEKPKQYRYVNHRWKCLGCDDKLFLRVDTLDPSSLCRLDKFEQYASKHVIETGHEMIHTEKEEKGFNFV